MTQQFATFFFYAFSCSVVLVYGIGFERMLFAPHPGNRFIARFAVLALELLSSVLALWFLTAKILVPFGYSFAIPMTVILVCGIIHSFLAIFLPESRQATSGEKMLFFGTVFLALYQATSLVNALVIVCASMAAFALTSAMLFGIRERVSWSDIRADWKGFPLMLVALGLVFVALYAADVSWWLSEVFR